MADTTANRRLFEIVSSELLITSALFIISLFAFSFITHEVVYGNEQYVDNQIFQFFADFSEPRTIALMKFFTFFGSANFLIPAYAIIIFYFIVKRKVWHSIHIALLAVGSTALMFAIKRITHRTRPELPIIKGITNFSYPSGHTLSVFVFCSILIFILWRSHIETVWRWIYSILLLLFAVMIGISRIILKVHYPTDVIASFCLGFSWVLLSFWVMKRYERRERRIKIVGI